MCVRARVAECTWGEEAVVYIDALPVFPKIVVVFREKVGGFPTVMNSSFLYHACGLYHHKCLREEYKGSTIILHIESKRGPKCCPLCGHAPSRRELARFDA